ncbi:MAG: hypothetical protein P1U56_03250, partial [Saprospiraceae bacterium]|nr:hypothetical protein [Saprospiraceae bacterium]
DIELSVENVSGASYAWTGPNGFSSTIQNPTITGATPNENGDYCVIITIDGCESEEACTNVTVKPTPPNPVVSNNGPICEGEDLELSAEFVTGASYAWTGPNGFTSNVQNPTVTGATPNESGDYCVIITIDGCISAESCTNMIIKENPQTPTAANNGIICEGEDLELSTDFILGATYVWNGPNGFSSTDENPVIAAATPNENGEYCVIVTVDGCESEPGCTTAIISPVLDAGEDQSILCAVLSDLEITLTATSTSNGSWAASTSNPGSVTFSDNTSENATLTNITIEGVYIFEWSNGICSDQVEITITEKPYAGEDQFVKCNEIGSAILGAVGNGTWSLGNVPGNVSIDDISEPNAVVTDFENPGIHEFIWTVGSCTDTVLVVVDDDCECPIANNIIDGNPEDYCEISSPRFIDGQPATPAGGTYQWQYNNGTGFSNIAANSEDYTTEALGIGTHVFRRIYSVTSPICADTSNQVTINVYKQPSAGNDQDFTCENLEVFEITMAGSGVGTWNQISGTGTSLIVNNTDSTTIISNFSLPGTYVYSYGDDICSDQVTITVSEEADAGPDQSIECFAVDMAVMAAVDHPDGVWTWGTTPGNDQPVFDMNDANASISGFAQDGIYNLTWTVGNCSDNVQIIVGDDCDCPIDNNSIEQPDPSQFCGQSLAVELIGSEASPEGEYAWEYQFGSNGFVDAPGINDQQNYTTELLDVGVHTFRRVYTTSFAPICSDISNEVVIEVLDQPDAGSDQVLECIDLPGGNISMSGLNSGTWSALTATNSGTANIVDPTNLNTEINGFSNPGIYGFVLSNDICKDTVYVSVTESVNAGPDQSIECYVAGSTTLAAITPNGTWSVGAVPPSAGNPIILSPGSPNSVVQGFDLPGTYQLIWTEINSNCSDEIEIVVGEDCDCPINNNNLIQPIPSEFCDNVSMLLIEGSEAMPGNGTYLWEYNFGSGFTDAPGLNDNKDYTTGTLDVGAYSFRRIYSIDTPECSDTSDIVSIIVLETPFAGPDQSLDCIDFPGATIMAATGVGTWEQATGNPVIVSINDMNSSTTAIDGFSEAGDYTFTFTNGECADEVIITVSESANAGVDQSVNCFLTGTASLSAVGSGMWSYGTTPNNDQPSFNMSNANTTISGFASAGTYEVIWTTNDGCTDVLVITVGDDCDCPIGNNVITQPDQNEFCFESEDVLIIGQEANPLGGTYLWEHSTDNINFGTAGGINNDINYSTGNLPVGEHSFRRIYDLDSPDCSDTSNVVTIIVYSQPDAGIDQTLSCVETPVTITMAGTGPGVWTSNAQNASVNIISPSFANTEITGLVSGEYFFTFSNGICEDEVRILITEEAVAGDDQSFNCFETATVVLNANGTGNWTWGTTPFNDQPGFDFTSNNVSVTGFGFAGEYNLIWTNDDGCTDELTLTIGAECDCPIANNIIDQPNPSDFCGVSPEIELTGSEPTPLGGAYNWEYRFEGGAWVSAQDPKDQRNYTTDALGVGRHDFRRRYSVTSPIACEDESNIITIKVSELAEAGPDQTVDCFEDDVATMAAEGTGEWSWVSGLTATIDQPSNPASTISDFPSAGIYTLVWTTQEGSCTDEVEITVGAACACPIEGNTIVQPEPSEYCGAGVDVTITGSEPTPTGGVYLWEYDSGSGFVTASGDFSSKDYEAINLGVGVHTFRRRYTVDAPIACEDISDVVTITVFEAAQAGPDQTVDCYEDEVATMSATGVGEWSWASGLTATIDQPSNPASTISDFPSAGTYTLVWTTQDGSCTDEVEIVVGD